MKAYKLVTVCVYIWRAPDVRWSLNDVNFWNFEILGHKPGSQKLVENDEKYQLQRTTVYMQCIYSVDAVYTAVCSVSAVYPFLND